MSIKNRETTNSLEQPNNRREGTAKIQLQHDNNVGEERSMVCFCFLVDQTKKVKRSKPVAGSCSRCGGGASVADMITQTRFCSVPFYCKSWKAIMCTFCGAMLKSYT
ncbi:hypothetical protein ACSQ67_023769 [Phaseolus vulgaris]